MIPYLLIYTLFAILFLLQPNRNNKAFFVFVGIVAILMAGFRDMIGGFDVYIYGQAYEIDYRIMLLFSPFEMGYTLFSIALGFINKNREFLFFIAALITISTQLMSVYKQSDKPGVSMFIYFCKFYIFTFIYLRQGLAMSFMWLTIPLIMERKWIKYLLVSALAFSFHKSSLIFILLPIIARRKLPNALLIPGLLLSLIIFATPLSVVFAQYVALFSENEKLAVYSNKSGGVNIFYVIELMIFISIAFMFKKKFYQDAYTKLIFNGFILYIFTAIIGLSNASFNRLTWYFFLFTILALTRIISFIKDPNLRKVYTFFIFLYYTLVFLKLLFSFDDGDLMPYKTIFQDFNRNGDWEWMEYRK
jgi:hypothetical protein